MQMTITYKIGEDSFDIRMDERQKIKVTLSVMAQTLPVEKDLEAVENVFSWRMNKELSVEDTYQEAGILAGDILTI